MCGFSFLSQTNLTVDLASTIGSMTSVIEHRGPDDFGYSIHNSFAFGFRRLSILDLSKAGHQPMVSGCGNCTIVFNGEIFNYLEIKKELIDLGVTFTSTGDTEVLLKAYMHWGEGCLEKLNGMFAFLIFDKFKNQIFGARDRFGIKPFYVYQDNNSLLISSEIKGILASGLVEKTVNWAVASQYLFDGRLEETDETFFSGIKKLPAGTAITIDLTTKQVNTRRYWELKKSEREVDDLYDDFFELFSNSVSLRMRSDVPLGVFLSGGLDSTSIICEMKRQLGQGADLTAYSFTSKQFDEMEYINATLEQTQAKIQYHSATAKDLWGMLDEALGYHDEPMHSMTALVGYSLMKMAKKDGVKVVLNGQGADEVLAGYPSYFKNYWHSVLSGGNISELSSEVRKYVNEYGGNYRQLMVQVISTYFRGFAQAVPFYKQLSAGRRRRRAREDVRFSEDLGRIYSDSHPAEHGLHLDDALSHSVSISPLPLYLRIEDRNSMASSVEARLPFMDYRLVELGYASPDSSKMSGCLNKFILRQSMKHKIPDVVQARVDKMGFPTPLEQWVRGDLYEDFSEVINSREVRERGIYDADALSRLLVDHRDGKTNAAGTLFRVVQFEKWLSTM